MLTFIIASECIYWGSLGSFKKKSFEWTIWGKEFRGCKIKPIIYGDLILILGGSKQTV